MTGSSGAIDESPDAIATCSACRSRMQRCRAYPGPSSTRNTAATAGEGRIVVSNSCNTGAIEAIVLEVVHCG